MDENITIPVDLYDDLRAEARNHEIIMDALQESAYTVTEGRLYFDDSVLTKIMKICFPVQYRYLVNLLEMKKKERESHE